MSSRIAKTACQFVLETTAMGLGIVFNQLEMMTTADIPYPIGIGTATVKMNDHHGPGSSGNGLFYQPFVNLKGIGIRLHEYRLEAVFGDREDARDIGVGRHDDLIALFHHTHIDIGAENQCQRIQTVGAADTVARTNIVGIVLFKAPRSLSTQIPPTVEHTADSVANLVIVASIHLPKVKITDHRSYS